ncbi:hypothetical protein F4V43_02950 [Paenibacillus spiritus]|uniref:Accessory regulator AgrB n=1 Tax=Paenibacillus spiritus TaxID=2496557 RepID=A0A5J5GID5_9BACL|nr:accessory gene regulator B family protein [Paenibacillus spiritus]KAA9007463.1 hypothetical protein F4V43_02950 [Paenibacillus spiritus]
MQKMITKLAVNIKSANPEETASIAILQYALTLIINTFFVFFLSNVIGFITGKLTETLILFIVICIFRFFSGGKHFKSAIACNLFSIALCTVLPHISSYTEHYIWFFNFFALVVMLLYAPNPDKNSNLPLKLYPIWKAIAVNIVLINFFLRSPTWGLAFFVQSLFVVPWKGGDFHYEEGCS